MKRLLLPDWRFDELVEVTPEPYRSWLKNAARDGATSQALVVALNEPDDIPVTRLRPVCNLCLERADRCGCDVRFSQERSFTGEEAS